MITSAADATIITVMMPRYTGASFQLRSAPRSQPNASQTAEDVTPGSTQAARKLAATRPAANSTVANSPAMGSSARAASAASATSMPAGYSTAPVVMMMNHAMAQAITEPVVVSMRCRTISDSSAFLSTTLFCARKIIHGAMVVPIVATSSET